MRIIQTLQAIGVLALAAALTGPLAATKSDVDSAMGRDGLKKINVKGLELVYARPGASLAAYKRFRIDPVEVEFDKSWDPTRPGSHLPLGSEERARIKADVARIVREEYVKALQKGGAYQLADDAAPDVLRVKVSILNLYINAPGDPGMGRSRTYVSTAGQMSLLAELADGASGQVLARVADRREANVGAGKMALADRFVNEDAAREVAAAWAEILRKAMDKARAIGS